MVNRILKILKEENLTASQFADLIDVQRSSMSHILSGRNNPSLDFVHKILKAFPLLNTDWLMSGTGEMYKSEKKQEEAKNNESTIQPKNQVGDLFNLFDSVETDTTLNKNSFPDEPNRVVEVVNEFLVKSEDLPISAKSDIKSDGYVEKPALETPSELNIPVQPLQTPAKIDSRVVEKLGDEAKKVEQIVIFYTDKTFSVYRPE
jgi:transcriptional regulator with XRE-family HTH domain